MHAADQDPGNFLTSLLYLEHYAPLMILLKKIGLMYCHTMWQHYLSRDALAPGWKSSKKINKFWKWLKLAKTIRFGFIVLFYIWEPWDVCWFSSDFHKMSIANHLLTKWNWMLWLVKDLRKISGSSIFHLCSKQLKSRLVRNQHNLPQIYPRKYQYVSNVL